MTKKKITAETPVLHGVKGFDANMRCRGFQFEIRQTYTHEGEVRACRSGFHAIVADAHPLAVFSYYPPAGSRFHRVELSGATHSDDNEKVAAAILKVGEEIGLNTLIQDAVKWVFERSTPEGLSATGDQGAASATGYQGAASATGSRGAASATGYQGKVRGALGNALFALERHSWNGPIMSVACGIVGEGGLKADTWYVCVAGQLVEAVS